MRTTKKKVLYAVLEVLFMGIAPLIFVVVQYSNIGATAEAVGFKVGITGILLAVIIFLVLKKTLIDRKLNNLNQQANNLISTLETETDPAKIANAEQALKGKRTLEVLSRAVMPVLMFGAALLCCKALEAELVKLSGCIGFILISYLVGTVFSVLNAREVVGKHRKEDQR